jgi:hypothetical protein
MGAQGTVEVDFGAFPGKVVVESDGATAGVVVTYLVEAWLLMDATADHTVDEHLAEKAQLDVSGRYKADGTITIRVGVIDRQGSNVPMRTRSQGPTGLQERTAENMLTYGKWTVAWVWN